MEKMPIIGFGLWKVASQDCPKIIMEAIAAGYRHFDCAADYGNEQAVGAGIKQALSEGLCTREDLWITSKLWNTFHAPEHAEEACQKSLDDLGLDYFDLYLIHFPIALEYVPIEKRYPPEWIYDPKNPSMKLANIPLYQTWEAMEKLTEQGLTRQIGVCNYNSALLHDLMRYAHVKPAVLQIESHPYLTQEKLIQLAHTYDVHVTAFSPLGALSYFELDMAKQEESLLLTKPVMDAAKAHDKSTAQILLRWAIQRGTSIIPKSSNPQHMRENLDILDFALSDDEMQEISGLNQDKRFNDPGVFCEQAFGSFHPIYD